ncbi:MAG TPA: FG-GAP-like repeat-containing protein [Ignavibacteria bacterium]|nr:FG-GAP-like repeat-containing protein [Ignavibacteria bacterium]HQY52707.1 FG-GAP-like repeat-containing protein [Ignavibacteria bacterium]HRA98875.1 FG-GAP-like repeat-containing protein [Ignavibacteria bacterium]
MNFLKTFLKPSTVLLILIVLFLFAKGSFAQNFVKVTDPNNPVVTEALSGNYFGTSWVDIDNDRLLDLFINRKVIFRNLGNGNFVKIETAMANQNTNIGNSWSDYNNDGLLDCFVTSTGGPFSYLFKNEGNGVINKVQAGDISDSLNNTGWGCAWADYNNDGFTDLFIAAANGFGNVFHPNRFFKNNGDGSFTKLEVAGLTDTLAPFTIPIWSDYDQDGDMDLFIGSGPGGSTSTDFLYKNMLTETGTSDLVRLMTSPMATDQLDGQVWNWIDYDNDGDLDGFITNYANNVPNNLYRNNNGVYEKMLAAQVGNIVSDIGYYLANVWGDFDNDGDLDCFLTRDVGQQSRYYNNNGNGTFTRMDSLQVVTLSGGNYGATSGDYDNNGTLDLFVTGSTNSKGLFKNELSNGNKWVNIKCIGSGPSNNLSNAAAIGTRVKAKATINGIEVWQQREVSAQNSFNSMNMLNVHMGFGNAAIIDSLIIIWPRGLKEVYTKVGLDEFYNAAEGQGIVSGIVLESQILPEGFLLEQNYPNPFNPSTKIKFSIPSENKNLLFTLKIFDILGKEVQTLFTKKISPGSYSYEFNGNGLSSGVYFYRLTSIGFSQTRKMVLAK